MKIYFYLLVLTFILISSTCTKQNKPVENNEYKKDVQDTVVIKKGKHTLELVNDCNNGSYTAKLQEYTNIDSNTFILTITFPDDQIQSHSLDLPPGRTKINNCSKNYVSLGSACGGPCYGLSFVFLTTKKPSENYMYCQIASSNENIITHIEDEEFEKLKVRNLDNGKEIIVDISNCQDIISFPCQIISTEVVGKNLILEYDSTDDNPKKQVVNIEKILNN